MHAIPSKQESAVAHHRFLLLFVFLLATLILFPYAEASHFGSYAFRVIGSFAIVVSVYAAKLHRSMLIFAIVLAIPAFRAHRTSQSQRELIFRIQLGPDPRF